MQTSKPRPPVHPAALNTMNPSIQSWDSLPDHIKQQAALEMLAGAVWSYFGKPVERPRDSELMRWVPPPVCPARRTNADKRRDVIATLKVMPRASLRAVARQTGTSHQFVANVRAASKRAKRGILKEESSTDDGEVSLPIVALSCSNTARTNANAPQCVSVTGNASDSTSIGAADVEEFGQRSCEIL